MYRLIESADYRTLRDHFLADYNHHSRRDPLGDTPLIVPTLPVGNILVQTLASTDGVASGITLRLWHNYEWMLIGRITGSPYGSQAPLSNTAIRWDIFSYLYQNGDTILADPNHRQHALLRTLYPHETRLTAAMTRRLWSYSGQLANLYTAYLNQRPDWLTAWQSDNPPPLDDLLDGDGLKTLPPILADHYRAHYQQQSRLWHDRFAAIHAAREQRNQAFWHILNTRPRARELLPRWIPVFALTRMTAAERDTMQRLGEYTDLTHYHLAASEHYIDDIVDSRWLRDLKRRAAGRATDDRHREHGHELVSRYGKQQRDLARLLHEHSDPERPDTPAITPHNLLTALQAEIRELREDHIAAYLAQTADTKTPAANSPLTEHSPSPRGGGVGGGDSLQTADAKTTAANSPFTELPPPSQDAQASAAGEGWGGGSDNLSITAVEPYTTQKTSIEHSPSPRGGGGGGGNSLQTADTKTTADAPPPQEDDSLRIHGCHGLQRQSETLRSDITAWLNADPTRRLSDIYIHLPDPVAAQTILRATFPPGGDYDGNHLPARHIGITENSAETLWRSLSGRYTLAHSRYDAPTVHDWLHNPDTCHSLNLAPEQIQRITAALTAAGYKRGYDGAQLQPALHPDDHDHRYTYTYALNRLIAGVLTPDAEHYRDAVPQPGLTLADLPALEALATLAEQTEAERTDTGIAAQTRLQQLRDTLHHDYAYAQNTPAWQTIDQALDELQQQLASHAALAPQNEAHYLPPAFIHEHIEAHLAAQQNSSEPSGVITIGSLKNLRNLPGRLHIFMNADRDHYPARQNDERYNLIPLDRPRPGDQNREHEDLGALLDLINRAEDALWIYYNTAENNEPQPPASPIQELLQYLDDQRERGETLLREQGKLHDNETLPRYYYHEHPADPFSADPYETATRPAAPLWQHIRQTLNQTTPLPCAAGEGRGGGEKAPRSDNTQPAPATTPDIPPSPCGGGVGGGVRPHTTVAETTTEPPPSTENHRVRLGAPSETTTDIPPSPCGGGAGGGDCPHTTVAETTTEPPPSAENPRVRLGAPPETTADTPPSPCGGGAGGGVRPHTTAAESTTQTNPRPFLTLDIPPAITANSAPETLTLSQLIRDTQKPASAYARAHHIANTAAQTPLAAREPLALTPLEQNQAERLVIAALEQNQPDPAAQLARLPAWPGGIGGTIQLEQTLAAYRQRQHSLLARARLDTWPGLKERTLDLGDHTTLTARLPGGGDTWPRLSASKARPKHQYRYWLEHLAWSASGDGGTSLIHYADDTLQHLAPVPAAAAITQLRQWIAVRACAQQTLWLAPVELMQYWLESENAKDPAQKQQQIIDKWLFDDNSRDKDGNYRKADDGDLWRHLWRGHDHDTLADRIATALAIHATLLQPLTAHSDIRRDTP